MAGRVRSGGRRTLIGRGTRSASAALVVALAAALAFSAPAFAQESPESPPGDTATEPTTENTGDSSGGTTPSDTTTPSGTTTPSDTTSGGGSEPPPSESDPADPPGETTTDDSAPPADTPASETPPPADTCASDGAAEPAAGCETAPDAGTGGDPAEPEASCETGAATTTESSAAGSSDGAAACVQIADPGPTSATPPPPAAPAILPPPTAPSQPAPTAAPTAIVLIAAEQASGDTAPTSLHPELANLLAPGTAGLAVTLTSDPVSSVELEAATNGDETSAATDSDASLEALWFQAAAHANRQSRGTCAPLVGSVPLSRACSSSGLQSILTAVAPLWVTPDAAPVRRTAAGRAADFQRHRRTHPEARADAEQPAVAAAPATSRNGNGIGVSGGSSGASSGSAASRIFAVSTLPLSLSAPVSFPTKPLPTVFPEGEPGVPPPASPG